MFQNLEDLVVQLESNPRVVGIVRYGSRRHTNLSPGGDFDLFVFVKKRPPGIESIHFYIADIPVDLNIRDFDDIRQSKPLTNIDIALVDAEILYDKTGALSQELASLNERWKQGSCNLTEHEVSWHRFCQQHVLDKVRGRVADEPLLCEFLLATNIYWLVQAYFNIRCILYPGEKDALRLFESKEPQMYAEIQCFYASNDLNEKLEISERLTELILTPIGGPWRKGEFIVFGTNNKVKQLQSKGQRVFSELFGITVEEALYT